MAVGPTPFSGAAAQGNTLPSRVHWAPATEVGAKLSCQTDLTLLSTAILDVIEGSDSRRRRRYLVFSDPGGAGGDPPE
jgi:hypothetical protein